MRRFRAEPEARTRIRGSILFQTGRADFFEKYLEAIAHWRARGWSVEGFDWRGQGGSGRVTHNQRIGHAPPFGRLVEDVADYVATWRKTAPGPYVVIGHSMGGHLLLRLLAERRGEVDGAVLLSPMMGINTGPLPETIAARIARLACRIGLAEWPVWPDRTVKGSGHRQANLTHSAARYQDEMWWRAHDPMLDLGPPSWGWLAESWASIDVLAQPGMLERVTEPVLALWPEHDGLVRAAATRRACARLPNARLAGNDAAAHELLREEDSIRLWAHGEIDAFIEDIGRRE